MLLFFHAGDISIELRMGTFLTSFDKAEPEED
jgi:hypothetical protein